MACQTLQSAGCLGQFAANLSLEKSSAAPGGQPGSEPVTFLAVHRADYLIFDRSKLRYLNHLERVNCRYCSYANGLIAYVGEIAARTEQHWCPIKHSHEIPSPHSRYDQFLHFGDAAAYREGVERVRCNFDDLNG